MSRRRKRGRKLLVASVGVAAVSYACGSTSGDGGTKDASQDTNQFDQVANLVAPDAAEDNSVPLDVVANLVPPDAAEDNSIPLDVVANLVAPDAGDD